MSLKKISNVEVLGNAQSSGNYVATSVNGTNFDSNNSAVVNTYTHDEILKIISVLPVSSFQYTQNDMSASEYIFEVLVSYNVLLSGNYVTLEPASFDLSTIKSDPSNTTFHMYIIMEQGIAKYKITDTVIAESGTSAYNTLWIGTIVTDSTRILYFTIGSRTRLDVFGPSSTAAGSSFPVSTGLPSQSGTISW